MTLKERLDSLRAKVKAKIKPETSAEELDELNGILGELDEIENEHNNVITENTKFKDTIVRMALTQGDGKTPDEPEGSNPTDMNQFLAKFEQEHK